MPSSVKELEAWHINTMLLAAKYNTNNTRTQDAGVKHAAGGVQGVHSRVDAQLSQGTWSLAYQYHVTSSKITQK
jgi:hypothetical protein